MGGRPQSPWATIHEDSENKSLECLVDKQVIPVAGQGLVMFDD
jgi:hypothetical protein